MVAVLLEVMGRGGEVLLTAIEVVLKSAGTGGLELDGSMTVDGSVEVSRAIDWVLAEGGGGGRVLGVVVESLFGGGVSRPRDPSLEELLWNSDAMDIEDVV